MQSYHNGNRTGMNTCNLLQQPIFFHLVCYGNLCLSVLKARLSQMYCDELLTYALLNKHFHFDTTTDSPVVSRQVLNSCWQRVPDCRASDTEAAWSISWLSLALTSKNVTVCLYRQLVVLVFIIIMIVIMIIITVIIITTTKHDEIQIQMTSAACRPPRQTNLSVS